MDFRLNRTLGQLLAGKRKSKMLSCQRVGAAQLKALPNESTSNDCTMMRKRKEYFYEMDARCHLQKNSLV